MKHQTAKEIQEKINKFESDFKAKDDALLEKKNAALKGGFNSQADFFQKERDRLTRYHDASLVLLEKRLEAVREWEVQEAAKQEAARVQLELDAAHTEAKTKKLALAKWIQSGGAPSDFESAWQTIYREILQEKTLQKLTKPARKPTFRF